jgi:hypothetical protein
VIAETQLGVNLVIEYSQGPGVQIFDPCYGAVYPDGKVAVYPNTNGNPAFLPFESHSTDSGHEWKTVFPTALTRRVMNILGGGANFWSVSREEWILE